MMPGLKATAAPVVRDDRETNQFEFELRYELPTFGNYERGTLTIEAPALEILDAMVGPREARRDMPWQYDPPRQMRQRVHVIAPRRFQSRPPAPQEVSDKHFGLTSRMEVSGNTFTLLLGYTRKLDEVLPGDLAGYRERVQAGRRLAGTTLRLPLLDADRLQGVFAGHRAAHAAPIRVDQRRAARDGRAPGARAGAGHRSAEGCRRRIAAGRPGAGQSARRPTTCSTASTPRWPTSTARCR